MGLLPPVSRYQSPSIKALFARVRALEETVLGPKKLPESTEAEKWIAKYRQDIREAFYLSGMVEKSDALSQMPLPKVLGRK